MATITNGEAGRKWREVGSQEWLEAMDSSEWCLNDYARAHRIAEIPSPDAAWRELLEDGVILHAYMRAVDPPGVKEWRTIAKEWATMAHTALKIGVVPLMIPATGVAPKHLGALHCLLPGKGIGGVGVAGSYPLGRDDLIRLETRATTVATRLRGPKGPKPDVAFSQLHKRVCAAIEERCPGGAKSYDNSAAGGLLDKIFAVLQPWLLGLEDLTPDALRLRLQRANTS
jgi:hypothetical protein